ncbi:FAD dependent oxidoreductase-domain-containing protein [Boeremia exigua]|uniref:FAD dependent oxidoreductase-domain-containing protein n=1 Tax=Boeremia exigua TaxID=749465 RepID=UPI001E8DE5DB|nr:FAD dependent oxidoreductase-domain-containing protein [Boeremia exigua]KAH6625925.1 FAD dependent oxidoreductase-domain-containing protein [Boeremia exigua]
MTTILVESADFHTSGGWTLDSQFVLEMGFPYLLAHGNGTPVLDATTVVSIPVSGQYNIWVRTKDWVPGYQPGRFELIVNEETLKIVFGTSNSDWSWQNGGDVFLNQGMAELKLHDLTGFAGRCEAIYLTMGHETPLNGFDRAARAWRRQLRGLPDDPVNAGQYSVVVLGGGLVGTAAALVAARLGERVALIHNRPYLGGNASVEIGLRPRGVTGPLVDEIADRHPDGDLRAKQLLNAELGAELFLEHTAFNATLGEDSCIKYVDARDARSGRELRFAAPIFIDCSGRALLGHFAGAETLYGQESRFDYGEELAPLQHEETHHGNTLFFRTRMTNDMVSFPHVPWAAEVAKDFSDLNGQLVRTGVENGVGPTVNPPDMTVRRRMRGPLTHFWEYGQHLDPYVNGEHIRDHLLRAIYGTFSNVKTMKPEEFAGLRLDWVAYVAAQGEFRRYRGDHVLTELDIRRHTSFPDAVVKNGGAFYWKWDERDGHDYDVPFRCLYSRNLRNLMMAGKHISVTHIAGSNTKFMGNGAQHGIATAVAAWLCNRHTLLPDQLQSQCMGELQRVTQAIADTNQYPSGVGHRDLLKARI